MRQFYSLAVVVITAIFLQTGCVGVSEEEQLKADHRAALMVFFENANTPTTEEVRLCIIDVLENNLTPQQMRSFVAQEKLEGEELQSALASFRNATSECM